MTEQKEYQDMDHKDHHIYKAPSPSVTAKSILSYEKAELKANGKPASDIRKKVCVASLKSKNGKTKATKVTCYKKVAQKDGKQKLVVQKVRFNKGNKWFDYGARDLYQMMKDDLVSLAKAAGVEGTSKYNMEQLIAQIRNAKKKRNAKIRNQAAKAQ